MAAVTEKQVCFRGRFQGRGNDLTRNDREGTGLLTDMEDSQRLGLAFSEKIDDTRVDLALLERLPLHRTGELCLASRERRRVVATGDPANLAVIDELRGLFGLPLEVVLVPSPAVLEAINHLYSRVTGSAQEVVMELEGEDLSTIATELNEPRDLLDLTDEAPVIRLLNSNFSGGEGTGSDIHIEPMNEVDVRFRIDGILYKISLLPRWSGNKYFPCQDHGRPEHCRKGCPRMVASGDRCGTDVDIRVSLIPPYGERVVLRLLDKKKGLFP
jgi:general secretion pathway protein E